MNAHAQVFFAYDIQLFSVVLSVPVVEVVVYQPTCFRGMGSSPFGSEFKFCFFFSNFLILL